MHAEDIAANQAMGRFGATLMPARAAASPTAMRERSATFGYGTAARRNSRGGRQGNRIPRLRGRDSPFLQGSRLTHGS